MKVFIRKASEPCGTGSVKDYEKTIRKIEEERFIESMIYLWISADAPEWIKDYVRNELRKQRGLSWRDVIDTN